MSLFFAAVSSVLSAFGAAGGVVGAAKPPVLAATNAPPIEPSPWAIGPRMAPTICTANPRSAAVSALDLASLYNPSSFLREAARLVESDLALAVLAKRSLRCSSNLRLSVSDWAWATWVLPETVMVSSASLSKLLANSSASDAIFAAMELFSLSIWIAMSSWPSTR
ncbi:hypothetical protein D3C87_1284420 [compost metagenome]